MGCKIVAALALALLVLGAAEAQILPSADPLLTH
jgi:hypothetical protein